MYDFVYITYVLIIAIAQFSSNIKAFPTHKNHEVKLHMDNEEFIHNIMIKDKLWFSILKEKINMVSLSQKHLDHFFSDPPPDSNAQMMIVDPFQEIVNLMNTKSIVGSEIEFIMEAVKRSMMCVIMKHISMQGFLVNRLIELDKSSDKLLYIIKWLEHMIQMSIDKLAAINQKLSIMAQINLHVKSLLDSNINLTANELNKISQDMFNELNTVCVAPEGQGHYRTLITEFKKPMTIEELKSLESLMADENLKGLSELHDIKEIQNYHGSLNINENINPEELSTLEIEEIKKILTINRIKMNYILLNLPIKSLAVSQWSNIFHSKPLREEK